MSGYYVATGNLWRLRQDAYGMNGVLTYYEVWIPRQLTFLSSTSKRILVRQDVRGISGGFGLSR